MSESQHTEYKQSWHDDYLKWICAFANANRDFQVTIIKILQSGQAGGAIVNLNARQQEVLTLISGME
jgi:hypothetical protein